MKDLKSESSSEEEEELAETKEMELSQAKVIPIKNYRISVSVILQFSH